MKKFIYPVILIPLISLAVFFIIRFLFFSGSTSFSLNTAIIPAKGAYAYKNTTNLFHMQFKEDPTDTKGIVFSNKLGSISFYTPTQQTFGTLNSTTSPVADGSTLIYPAIFPGIDLKYTITISRLLEEFIVKDAEIATQISRIEQRAQTKSTYVENDDGSITFYNKDKKVFTLPHPVMYEINNQESKSDGIVYEIKQDKNQLIITKVITDEGKAWLADPKRLYPIAIDLVINNATTAEFATGIFNRVKDTGSGSSPILETYYQELPADQYTVGLWHMNEASGNALDSSGNSLTGTPTNTTVNTTTQRLGSAARTFDGSGDYLTVAHNALLNFSTNPFTIEAWIKTTTASDKTILLKRTTAINAMTWIRINTGLLTFYTRNSAATVLQVSSTATVNDGNWHHIAAVRDSSSVNIYIDGVFNNRTAGTIVDSDNTESLIIGEDIANGATTSFDGSIDEVRISKIARTPEEIKSSASRRPYSIYTSDVIDMTAVSSWNPLTWTELGVNTGDGETLKSSTGLVAQWNFNETSGTNAANAAGSCGASCNGTLTNFASTASQDQAAGTGWTANNRRWGAGALMFDGSNDYVVTTDNATIPDAITLETWVNRAVSGTNQSIISWGPNDATANGVEMYINTSNILYFRVRSGSGTNEVIVHTNQTIPSGQWLHIVGTQSSVTAIPLIYINGIQISTTTDSAQSPTRVSGNKYIGHGVIQNYKFNGTIDSTRIYSRALGAAEIMSNYQAANVEFQTRVGSDTSPDDGSWEAWKPTTGETAIESYDGPYQYNTTDSGLVSYWPMDETADNSCSGGEDACDRKTTNHGTATGTKIVDGKFGKARSFAGTSDYVSVPDSANWAFGTGDFTINTWVNFASISSHKGIIGQRQDGTNFMSLYWDSSNNLYFHAIDGGTWRADYHFAWTPTINTWYHLAVVRSGTTFTMYLNGVPQTLTTTTAIGSNSIGNITGVLGIGLSSTFYMNGMMDESQIWNSALSATTIKQKYLEGSTRPETLHPMTDSTYKLEGSASQKIETGRPEVDSATVGLWHLDETGGTGAYIKDSTANANHGTQASTTLTNGFTGKARSFSGSTASYISNTSITPTLSGNLTVQAWFKTSATPSVAERFIDLAQSSAVGLQVYMTTTGVIGIDNSGGPTSGAATTLTYIDNKWHHVAVTRSETTYTLYVDGASVGTSGGTAPTYTKFFLGKRSDDYGPWEGSLDEFKVDNLARTAEEIAEAYRSGRDHYINKTISATDLSAKTSLPFYVAADRPGSYLSATIGESAFANYQPDANTVGLWHLDEQSGSGAYFKDSSGNNNHGTPTGTTFVQGKIGKGRSFNGTSDFVSISDTSGLDPGSGDYTGEAWIKTTAGAESAIYENGDGTNVFLLRVLTTTGKIRAYFSQGANEAYRDTSSVVNDGNWHHIVATWVGSTDTINLYVDGVLNQGSQTTTGTVGAISPANAIIIGRRYTTSMYFPGQIDEVRVSNTARTADEIRQAYEIGLRTHPITIDFGAKLDSGDLITGSGDLGFTVDATYYGLQNKGDMLFKGDKVIVRENYDGTEYIAQGTVDAITASTGATTVSAWDASSTFPSGGYTVNASVFKWQREYWNITEPLDSHLNAVTNLTLRLTDGAEGRTIWLDDLKSNSDYLTTPAGSTITSSIGNQYFQYRAFLTSFDEAVSGSVTSATIDYSSLTPAAPTIGSPTTLSTTSIRWAFTDNASNEDGFKVYDNTSALVQTCATANLTYCDETGLSPNVEYIRKVAAYNSYGNSSYSATATKYTLAAAPAAPVVSSRAATTVSVNPDPGTNSAATEMAIYREEGSTCDGAGGVYLAANGSSNGATAIWQTDDTWGTVTATGLTSEKVYTFCVKARNGNSVETAFSAVGSYNVGFFPISGDYVCNQETASSSSFTNRYVDGSNANRYVIALDSGTGATNSAKFEAKTGCIMTLSSTDTMAVGSLTLSGGSIAIANGATIKINQPVWIVDADEDGYSADGKLYYGTQPVGGRRKNLATTLVSGNTDCNDASYNTSNICCTVATRYQDADGDTYGNPSVSISACPTAGYVDNNTDCYDANANAKPGSAYCSTTNRGDGSYDYNCSSSSTACGTQYYSHAGTYAYYTCRTNGCVHRPDEPAPDTACIGGAATCGATGYTPGGYGIYQNCEPCTGYGPYGCTTLGAAGTQACQ